MARVVSNRQVQTAIGRAVFSLISPQRQVCLSNLISPCRGGGGPRDRAGLCVGDWRSLPPGQLHQDPGPGDRAENRSSRQRPHPCVPRSLTIEVQVEIDSLDSILLTYSS